MNLLSITVRAEYTPNPNSLKFICSETLYPFPRPITYNDQAAAQTAENKLALELFEVSGVKRVFIMSNFVTIDKEDDINWKDIHTEIKDKIKTNVDFMKKWSEENAPEIEEVSGDSSDLRFEVERVLDKIRPALVADGGNIELVDIVGTDARLRMVGACGTCPSAMMTMKMGVEKALLAELPGKIDTVTQVY
jgi:Fe-S cluster biogenesis protein NfuA